MKYVIQDVLNKNFNFNRNYEVIRKQIMIISSKLYSLTNNRDFYEDKINLLFIIFHYTHYEELLT